MSTRKPSATARQHLVTKKARLTDLAPRSGAAQKVKGGPTCPTCRKGYSVRSRYIGETEK